MGEDKARRKCVTEQMRNKGVEKARVVTYRQNLRQGKEGERVRSERTMGWQDFAKESAPGWRSLGSLEHFRDAREWSPPMGVGERR